MKQKNLQEFISLMLNEMAGSPVIRFVENPSKEEKRKSTINLLIYVLVLVGIIFLSFFYS